MEPKKENRGHPRIDLLAQVQVSRESEVHIMSTLNISYGGVFIQGDPKDYPDLENNAIVELVIFVPNHLDMDDVRLMAKVVRVETGTVLRPSGFGLQFVALDGPSSQKLKVLISDMRRKG